MIRKEKGHKATSAGHEAANERGRKVLHGLMTPEQANAEAEAEATERESAATKKKTRQSEES